MTDKKTTKLRFLAKFTLFVTSYLPLFVLLIVRQIYDGWANLIWGGLSQESIFLFLNKFGLSVVLSVISVGGIVGAVWTFQNLRMNAANGSPAKLVDVKNKNNESIGYIATYIIPFLFDKLSGPFEFFAITFLLVVIFNIYVNSTMLIINPVLGMWYSIYEITYTQGETKKNGMIISRSPELLEGERIKLYPIGFKLFYGSDFEKTMEVTNVPTDSRQS
jgi:hypothetical protein